MATATRLQRPSERDDRPVSAYRRARQLARLTPDDPDFQRYSAEATALKYLRALEVDGAQLANLTDAQKRLLAAVVIDDADISVAEFLAAGEPAENTTQS